MRCRLHRKREGLAVDMAKDFARKFYNSSVWHDCRRAYAAYRGGLCERCLRRGYITPGQIVHHKIPLTPENINDENITLSWDNLELVCRDCHGEIHSADGTYRTDGQPRVTYAYDATGRLVGALREKPDGTTE